MKGLVDFWDASREVAGTERRIKFDGNWHKCIKFQGVQSIALLQEGKKLYDSWWPTIEQAKEKAWEVEPVELEEIILWGACDDDGEGHLFIVEPEKYSGNWDPGDKDCLTISVKNLFPDTKKMVNPVSPRAE